jgi:hypothetical protein
MQFETGESKPYERVRIPEDYYLAVFKGIREVKDGKFGKRVAFLFEVDVDNTKVELATIAYNKKATPKNYIGTILFALGAKVDGTQADTDKLIGNKCRVAVDDYTYKTLDGKDATASTITKVKPLTEKVN